jgi:hypothetical protein
MCLFGVHIFFMGSLTIDYTIKSMFVKIKGWVNNEGDSTSVAIYVVGQLFVAS